MLGELTWTCHVCGDTRPDAKVSVFSRDISKRMGLPEGTAQENIRYCNDRDSCIKGAKTKHHVPEGPDDA